MIHSIRWRLVASYVFLTLVTVSAVGLLAGWAVQRYTIHQETRSLTANAEAIAQQAAPLLANGDHDALVQLARAAAFFGNVRVRILDRQGQALADSGAPWQGGGLLWFLLSEDPTGALYPAKAWLLGARNERYGLNPKEALPLLEELPPDASVTLVRRFSEPWGDRFSFEIAAKEEMFMNVEPAPDEVRPRSSRIVSVPVSGPNSQAAGFVELSAGTDYGAEALETTRRAFLLAGIAAVLLAAFLGWLMGSRLSAPLAELTNTTARMSDGDLSVRARKTGRDEIGRLAEQFNRMAAQLQASFNQLGAERDSLRRFISDASHELRTPITALKNFNELLQGAAAADPAARLEFLAESQIQIERLEWITRNLLDLSRLEAGLAALEIDRCSLDELIDGAAAPFLRQASQKGISLVVHPSGPRLEIECDRARFQIALANLLDNAVKYTPEHGKVEVWTERVEAAIRITVRDTGPGIDPDDLPHIFERFYRGRGITGTGSGLGLAIVHSVVQAHGGRIWVESSPGRGTQFMLEWPAA